METQLLARGVDTLVLNFYYLDDHNKPVRQPLAEELKEQLDGWKQVAIVAEEPVPIPLQFEGVNLHMYPNGAGKGQWRWLMRCDNFNFLVSMGRFNGIAQVRLSSEHLWSSLNLDTAITRIEQFVSQFFQQQLFSQVSEVHLCADVAGWDVETIDQRKDFVSRSRKRGVYEVTDLAIEDFSYGLKRSGFLFSRGGPISCVIYDKTREIAQQSQKWWMHDIWHGNGWDEETHPVVWRVEFRFKRDVLREISIEDEFHGLNDATHLAEHLDALWAYAAGHEGGGADGLPDGWLRYVVPGKDKNRSRWDTHPVWEQVQGAFRLPTQEIDRSEVIRERKRQANIEKAVAATVGYLSSIAAWLGQDGSREGEADLLYMMHWLRERTPVYLNKVERTFAQAVEKKRVRFEQYREEEQAKDAKMASQ